MRRPRVVVHNHFAGRDSRPSGAPFKDKDGNWYYYDPEGGDLEGPFESEHSARKDWSAALRKREQQNFGKLTPSRRY